MHQRESAVTRLAGGLAYEKLASLELGVQSRVHRDVHREDLFYRFF